jgi:tetratricopeptide (TPR) repeat protein
MHENSPDAAVYAIELELLRKMGRHQEALEIHDWICRDGAHWNISSRAIYRAAYLNDYWGALNDWDQIIDNIPEKYMTDRWMGSNEYGYAYSQRALVQFALNNPSKGYSDFYHSLYFFGNEQQIPTILNALDSLDRRGFNDPKVLMIRAMAAMRAGMDHMNSDRQKESAYEKAIKYFDKVDKSYRNFGDYYFFLAEAHFLYKKYDEAYAAIQTAFKYDDKNPQYYMMRYVIRIRLDGDRKTGADEDRVRSNELSQKAKYPIK